MTTTEHIYHVETARVGGIDGWEAVCRCGYRALALDRVQAASYGTEHCQLWTRKTVAR